MEIEIDNLKKLNSSLELQLVELKEKIYGTEKDINFYEKRYHSRIIALRQIKIDVYTLYQDLKDFKKLKNGTKALNYKYHKCDIDDEEKLGESDVQRELLVQRMYLEKTIIALKSTLQKTKNNKSDKAKIIQDNVVLLEELNHVRKGLAKASTKIKSLENLTASKQNKPITPSEAYSKLQKATENQEAIKRTYQTVIDGANIQTTNLNTKMIMMQKKLTTLLDSAENQ